MDPRSHDSTLPEKQHGRKQELNPRRWENAWHIYCRFTAQCYILGQWLPKTAAFDRVPSILTLGLFLPVSDFTQPENGLPTPPLPLPYTGCHQTASYSPKMAPLHFCTSGSEMPLTEEPGLYKRPCPGSPEDLSYTPIMPRVPCEVVPTPVSLDLPESIQGCCLVDGLDPWHLTELV
jgi:hypothetical protein